MSRVKNGLKSIYYAVMTEETEETYGTVKKLGELIEVSVSTAENATPLYAGNRLYENVVTLGEINVSFTIPEISDEDFKAIFGYEADSTYGGIIRDNSTSRPKIAIMFEQTAGDVTDYITLYKGTCNIPEIQGKTSESGVQYNTLSFSGVFMPLADGTWCMSVASDDPKYSSSDFATKWGKQVIKPTVAE